MASRKNLFDRKFGDGFLDGVPLSPGVYEMLDAAGTVLYVGKAKRLRRRLQQYRNARRVRKHAKMRTVLVAAHALRVTPCESDLDALLLENRLIQSLRPRYNVAGAFSFLYPSLGLRRDGRELHLCYSTAPGSYPMFELFGSFRSRQLTGDAFDALLQVLGHLGHRQPSRKLPAYPRIRFSRVGGFRQLGDEWIALLRDFLRGESKAFLSRAVLALLEKPKARRYAAETQEAIDALDHVFRFEALPLRDASRLAGESAAFVRQEERDRLFLAARAAGIQRS